MNRIALNIIFFLALYLPLEDFLLKWLPVPYTVYLALRQVPDALVIIAAVIAVGARTYTTARFRLIGRTADLCLVLFLLSALTSMLAQGGDLLPALLNLKALLRYILVVYALINIRVTRNDVHRLLRYVGVSMGIQIAISGIQLVAPTQVDTIFLPRLEEGAVAGMEFKSTSAREVEDGYIFGTMTNTIAFGGFLLVGLATYLTRFRTRDLPLRYWGAVILILLMSFMSGSRAVTIATVLLTLTHQYMLGRLQKLTLIGLTAVPLIFSLSVLVSTGLTDTYFFEIFSGAYIDKAMDQRLGIVVQVVPYFLAALSPVDLLLGLSGDVGVLETAISDMFDIPLLLVTETATIEDVYWAALLIYYGLVGFVLWAGFLGATVQKLRAVLDWTDDALIERGVRISLLLFVVAVPLNFLGQFFEVRQFAFYLWTFVGVSISHAIYCRQRVQETETVSA